MSEADGAPSVMYISCLSQLKKIFTLQNKSSRSCHYKNPPQNFSRVMKMGISQWKVNNRDIINILNKSFQSPQTKPLMNLCKWTCLSCKDRDWHFSFVFVVFFRFMDVLKAKGFRHHKSHKKFSFFKYSQKLKSLSALLNNTLFLFFFLKVRIFC